MADSRRALKNALSLALWEEAAMSYLVGKGEGKLASPAVLMGRKVLADLGGGGELVKKTFHSSWDKT